MSTAESAASRPRREILPWVGHNAWWMQAAINVGFWGYIAYGVATRGTGTRETSADWYREPSLYIIGGLILLSYWLAYRARKHERTLCTRCAEITPLDPQQATHRHRRALLAHHGWVSDNETAVRPLLRAAIINTLGLLIVLGALGVMVASLWLSIPRWLTVVLSVVVVTGSLTWPYIAEIHRRLYPWCPYCKDDDGWDDHGDHEPSPTPQGTKELTT